MPLSRFVSILFLVPLLFLTSFSFGALDAQERPRDIAIFDIRRPVAMSADQIPPRDFYINAGSAAGLRVGMVITAMRRQTLYDNYQNRSPGDLVVPVGELRIIHVQDNISVAREEKILDRRQLPSIEYDAIMVGDRLDVSTARAARPSPEREETQDQKEPTQRVLFEELIASTP